MLRFKSSCWLFGLTVTVAAIWGWPAAAVAQGAMEAARARPAAARGMAARAGARPAARAAARPAAAPAAATAAAPASPAPGTPPASGQGEARPATAAPSAAQPAGMAGPGSGPGGDSGAMGPGTGGGKQQGAEDKKEKKKRPPGCGMGSWQSMIFLVLMFAVFYFLLIRPQQKKQKEHQTMLTALKVGDQVITQGGMLGKITGFTDPFVVLELQEKVRIKVLRSSISGKHGGSVDNQGK